MKPIQISKESLLARLEEAIGIAESLNVSPGVTQAQDYEFAEPLPTIEAFESFDHELKSIPEFFMPLAAGAKPFDLRYDDRDFKIGDTVLFLEWNDINGTYSGQLVQAHITYILHLNRFIQGLDSKWIVLGLSDVNPTWR